MKLETDKNDLKKKIIREMTIDYSKVLEKNFDLAKQFIRLTREGDIEILVKDKLTGKESILLYLIGKLYSKEAGFTPSDEVGNQEFLDNLAFPIGSLLPWLKSLRDENKIKQIKRDRFTYHSIPINLVAKTLKEIEKKLKEST
jgi:hypothetical protein